MLPFAGDGRTRGHVTVFRELLFLSVGPSPIPYQRLALIRIIAVSIVGLIVAGSSTRLTRARPSFAALCCYLTRPSRNPNRRSEMDILLRARSTP